MTELWLSWRDRNLDKWNTYKKAYLKKNRKKMKQYAITYYQTHKKQVNARSRRNYIAKTLAANPDYKFRPYVSRRRRQTPVTNK